MTSMTPKELLYLEDSLGMEQQLHVKCNDYSGKIQNPALRNVCTQMAQQHRSHYSSLMNHLGAR